MSKLCILYNQNLILFFSYIFRAGVLNSKLEYGVEKKVSKLNTFAATVQIDVINGVTLKIKYTTSLLIYKRFLLY